MDRPISISPPYYFLYNTIFQIWNNHIRVRYYCFVFFWNSNFVCKIWFSRKKNLNSFPEYFIAIYFWQIKVSQKLLVLFFIQPTAIASLFLYFLMIQASFFEKKYFVNINFSLSPFLSLCIWRYHLHMGHYLLL